MMVFERGIWGGDFSPWGLNILLHSSVPKAQGILPNESGLVLGCYCWFWAEHLSFIGLFVWQFSLNLIICTKSHFGEKWGEKSDSCTNMSVFGYSLSSKNYLCLKAFVKLREQKAVFAHLIRGQYGDCNKGIKMKTTSLISFAISFMIVGQAAGGWGEVEPFQGYWDITGYAAWIVCGK